MGLKYHDCAGIFWVSGACRGRDFFAAAAGLYREHCAAAGPILCRGKGPRVPFLCSFDPGLRCFDLGVFGVVPRGHSWDF